MSLFKIASVAAIALTLGACASLFQPNYRTPLETTRDASETLKPGCSNPDCPLVNIDTLRFPAEPALDGIIEKRLLQMTRTAPNAPVAPTLAAHREQFLANAGPSRSVLLTTTSISGYSLANRSICSAVSSVEASFITLK